MPTRRPLRLAGTPPPARGITLIGLLAWAIVAGTIGYLLIRVIPTITEHAAIQRIVDRIAADPPSTVAGIQQAFDKQRDIDQTVSAIGGKDLDITKENDKVVIGYRYEKEIELVAPVFLLIKYEGRSR